MTEPTKESIAEDLVNVKSRMNEPLFRGPHHAAIYAPAILEIVEKYR